jgi:hypothetical protein
MLMNGTVVLKSFQFQLPDCVAVSGDLRVERQGGNSSEANEACSLYSKGTDKSVTGQHKSSATNQTTELHLVYKKELEPGVAHLV